MAYYLYVLRSGYLQYVGTTKDLKDRIYRHNSGQNKSTKHRNDWKLVYFKKYDTRGEARKKEIEIKRSKQKFCFNGA